MNVTEISPIAQEAMDLLSGSSQAAIRRLTNFLAGVKLPDLSCTLPKN